MTDKPVSVAVVGTWNTKAPELEQVRARVEEAGAVAVPVDTSTAAQPGRARADALTASGDAAGTRLADLRSAHQLDAAVAVGGSGGTEIAARAMHSLPRGVPKLILSTVGAGIDRFVGISDLTVMHAITDVAGPNPLLRSQLDQLAAAAVAMAQANRSQSPSALKVAAVSMFGITTIGGEAAAAELRQRGWEVMIFHTNGTGGAALEQLAAECEFDAVLDLTTTELADEVAGGQRSAGPDRLTAAGRTGIPQVVSLGGLDAVNFGARDTVPSRFAGRTLYRHGELVTLMRTDEPDASRIAEVMAAHLNDALGAVVVVAPLRGFSELDRAGAPFDAPAVDAALRRRLRDALAPHIEYIEVDLHLNDPEFGRFLAKRLDETHQSVSRGVHEHA